MTQKSKYPLPWRGAKNDRPKDYFEQIETSIRYTEHEKEIEISIPAVKTKDHNRKRKLKILVNGKEYPLNESAAAAGELFPDSRTKPDPDRPVGKLKPAPEPAVMAKTPGNLKSAPEPVSDFDLELLEQYEAQFFELMKQLEAIKDQLAIKNNYKNYSEVLLSVTNLVDLLKGEMDVFFKNPTSVIYQACQDKCQKAIRDTLDESAKHRGWPSSKGFTWYIFCSYFNSRTGSRVWI